MNPADVEAALALLRTLGASPWLVQHHALVAEAGAELLRRIGDALGDRVDADRVLVGCALHDAGKVLHPDEQHRAGRRHEAAGQRLLLDHGVDADIARFCVSHGTRSPVDRIEDLVVALCDTLWKGKRDRDLEERVVGRLAQAAGVPFWDAYPELDSAFEAVAAGGPDRLWRSVVTGG